MLKKKIKSPWAIPLLSLILLVLIIITLYNLNFSGKIYPNVSVAGVDVSGLSPQQAEIVLLEKVAVPKKIVFVAQGTATKIPTASLSLSYGFSESAQDAYFYYRTANILVDLYQTLFAATKSVNLPLKVKLDEAALNEVFSVISEAVSEEPVYPSVKFVGDKVLVEKGRAGSKL